MTGKLSKEALIEKAGAMVEPNFPAEDESGFFEKDVIQRVYGTFFRL
jgi:hypothetical protein